MENRIKECQLDLFADRTSAATMRANQLRLWFAAMAYVMSAACAGSRFQIQIARRGCRDRNPAPMGLKDPVGDLWKSETRT